MSRISIKVDDHGNAIVSVEGVEGQGCLKMTEQLEFLLGARLSQTQTDDFHKRVHVDQSTDLRLDRG